ncbi:MAG: 2-oxoacid:acceptor oxidoreductase family protein [Anaerolineae bacterium]|jgi:pyruvate ferredoxin oxidoreductase gamma subunit
MNNLTEIRWHGRAGQGLVTAAKLLGETALGTGQYFQAFPDYGPERMGAPIRAYTRLSPEPITIHSQIHNPNVVLVLDPTLLDLIDVTEGLQDGGTILVNTDKSPAEIRQTLNLVGRNVRVYTVDASAIAIATLGREITNTPMLGAFARATGLFPLDKIIADVRKNFSKKLRAEVVEANVQAVQRAYDTVQEG